MRERRVRRWGLTEREERRLELREKMAVLREMERAIEGLDAPNGCRQEGDALAMLLGELEVIAAAARLYMDEIAVELDE